MSNLQQYLLGSRGHHAKADLERMGTVAASRFLSKKASLNDAITQIAREEGLNQHQVQLVAGFANTNVFQNKFEKMASPKVVEFPIADPKVIMRKLGKQKTAAPVRSFQTPTDYTPGGDRVDVYRSLFGEKTLAKVAHREVDGPTRGEMEKAWQRLNGEMEKAASAFQLNQVHLQNAEAEFARSVERAIIHGEATLSDVFDAVSGVAPSLGVVKEAMAPVLDYLMEKRLLTRERVGKQKLGHRVPDPNHPVVNSFLYLCKVATDLRASQLAAIEFQKSRDQVQNFLTGKTKTAAGEGFSWAKQVGKGALYAGGGLAALGLFHGAAHLLDKVKERKLQRVGFPLVLKENPDLKRLDQSTVRKHYGVLAKFNPEMAGDPTVAGSWLRMTAQRADIGLDPKTIKDLVDIQKARASTFGDEGLTSGALRALAAGTATAVGRT